MGGKGSKIIDMGKNLIGGFFNRGNKKPENENRDEPSEVNSEQSNDEDTEENNGGKDHLAEARVPGGSQMTMQQCSQKEIQC